MIFVQYFSDTVTKDLIEELLVGSECDSEGTLYLILQPNRELIQKGPYILPPIRWLESMDKSDEFIIICKVVNKYDRATTEGEY